MAKKIQIKTNTDKDGNIVLTVAPGKNGDTGVGIREIVTNKDVIQFILDDGKVFDYKIEIPKPVPGAKGDKGDKGDQGISITDIAVDTDNKLIFTFSDGKIKVIKLNIRQGEDGVSPVLDYDLIEKSVIKNIKDSVLEKVKKEILDAIVIPEAPKVDEAKLVADILNKIIIPLPPNVDEVAKVVLENIQIPQLLPVPTALQVAQALKESGLVKDGEKGEDSPLSKVVNATGYQQSILGKHDQILVEHSLPDGFTVLTVSAVGRIADGTGSYASETRYFLDSKGGNLSKTDEKPVYNAVSTNSSLKSFVAFKGNNVYVYGNGAESSETTWKIDIIVK